MALRIHFTGDDLARVVLPPHRGATLGEAVLSLQVMRRRDQPLRFDPWRKRLRGQLPAEAAPLLRLLPADGWMPDFLTPPQPSLAEELEALSGAPRRRIAEDLTRLGTTRRLPGWTRPLADGDTDTLDALRRGLEAYHAVALAPYSQRINAMLEAERGRLMQVLASGGAEAMLSTLHPTIRWQAPVLELPLEAERDFHLDGRTLAVTSRFFCGPRARALLNDTDTPAVVYPMPYNPFHPNPLADVGPGGPETRVPPSLAALLGRTRAAVLVAVADSPGASTSQLARLVGVSPASASEHASVLRDAGLVASVRSRHAVCHLPTALAAQLLDRGAQPLKNESGAGTRDADDADGIPRAVPFSTANPDARP